MYYIFAILYASLIHLLGSMWLLFCGKKRNVFRLRIDTLEYNLSQMIFGTLLFIISLFLLPNILIFSTLFMLIKLSQFLIEAVLASGYVWLLGHLVHLFAVHFSTLPPLNFTNVLLLHHPMSLIDIIFTCVT